MQLLTLSFGKQNHSGRDTCGEVAKKMDDNSFWMCPLFSKPSTLELLQLNQSPIVPDHVPCGNRGESPVSIAARICLLTTVIRSIAIELRKLTLEVLNGLNATSCRPYAQGLDRSKIDSAAAWNCVHSASQFDLEIQHSSTQKDFETSYPHALAGLHQHRAET